jgi:hypothetical protein
VKLRINPRSGTIAIERPKLNAILSMLSILLFFLLIGNRVVMIRYPGMKKIKGKLKIMRINPSESNKIIGTKAKLQIRHNIISTGYFVKAILIL